VFNALRLRFISSAVLPLIFFCGFLSAKDYKAGNCIFTLPDSPKWSVTNSDNQTITVAYKYTFNNKEYNANMQVSCVDKKLEDALGDDFKQSPSGLAFQDGSGGGALIAKKVKGVDWHGWQVKYFQNNVCLLTVGSTNNTSSFRSEVCDSQSTIEPQIGVVKNILQNLSSH
jgi:hypothetical protein